MARSIFLSFRICRFFCSPPLAPRFLKLVVKLSSPSGRERHRPSAIKVTVARITPLERVRSRSLLCLQTGRTSQSPRRLSPCAYIGVIGTVGVRTGDGDGLLILAQPSYSSYGSLGGTSALPRRSSREAFLAGWPRRAVASTALTGTAARRKAMA